MLRKFILALSLLLVFSIASHAQEATLYGVVTSSQTGEVLPGATLQLDKQGGTATDLDGKFELKTTAGKHTLSVKLISFLGQTLTVELKGGERKLLNIKLEASAQELKLVVVSAGKFEQKIEDVTVSMEVLKPNLVEARNNASIEEAMDYVPGVTIIDGQANIRGGSGWSYGAGSRVQILVDDLPQLTADAGDAKWSFLPVENLEQVEVIKGASSVMFGSSALNGVINLRTAYPKLDPVTKVNFFLGAYDKASITLNDTTYPLNKGSYIPNMNGGLNFFHSRRIGQLDLVVGGNMFLDEGYREGENEHRARFNFNTRYRFKKIDGLSAGINFNAMMTDGTSFFLWKNDTSGAYIPAANTLSDYTTYRTNIDPFLTYIGKKGNSHKLRTRLFSTNNQNNTNQASTATVYYAEYQYQKRIREKLTLTTGIVEQRNVIKSELYSDHDGNQLAGYLQADYKWKMFTFSAGARAEQNKVDSISEDWTPVYRGGINIHVLKETYLRGSYGQGYRFPSVAERFVRTNVGSLYIYPDSILRSEKGYSAEVGLRQGLKAGTWLGYIDVAVFRSEYKNMMEFVFAKWGKPTDPMLGYGFSSLNVGNTRIDGIDVSLMLQGKIAGDLSATFIAGYTYLDPKQLSYDSAYAAKAGYGLRGSDSTDFLKYRYRHMGKADLELDYRRFSLGGSVRYNSKMENIDYIFVLGLLDAAFRPGLGIQHYRTYHDRGDLVLDLRASCQLSKILKASFVVKNVSNHIYMQRPADMQPPRTFVLQMGLTL